MRVNALTCQKIFSVCGGVIVLTFMHSSHAKIKFSHNENAHYTHQPVLYEIARTTEGPIIEFGCGYGSTDLLHEICKPTRRLLITLDDNLEWLSTFSKKYQEDAAWHKFIFVSGKSTEDPSSPQHWINFLESSELLNTTEFALCFIDQSPWLGRFETMKHMKNRARFTIIHDCDYFPGSGVFGKIASPFCYDFSDVFQHFKVYFPLMPWPGVTGPPTLLGSDTEPNLPEIDYNQY